MKKKLDFNLLGRLSNDIFDDGEIGPICRILRPALFQEISDLFRAHVELKRRPETAFHATINLFVRQFVRPQRFIFILIVYDTKCSTIRPLQIVSVKCLLNIVVGQIEHAISVQNLLIDDGKAIDVAFGRSIKRKANRVRVRVERILKFGRLPKLIFFIKAQTHIY